MTSIPEECFEMKGHTGASLVCEERGRKMVFKKPSGRVADKIRIDGCVIRNKPACDYLVRDWLGRQHFVELKGRHDEEALKQIEATIPLFVRRGSKKKFWCFVVTSGSSPASLPGIQSQILRIRKRWKYAEIKIRTNLHKHELKDEPDQENKNRKRK
jgi:hypothetical protein